MMSKLENLKMMYSEQQQKIKNNSNDITIFFCNFFSSFNDYLNPNPLVTRIGYDPARSDIRELVSKHMKPIQDSSGFEIVFPLHLLENDPQSRHALDDVQIDISIHAEKSQSNFLIKVCGKSYELPKEAVLGEEQYKKVYDDIYTEITKKISNSWSHGRLLAI
jgi:hypothetical protein